CHNSNSSSTAWATKLFMRLDASQLDGRAVNDFDTLTTTIGVPAVTPAWIGQTRISPHDPGRSLLYQLISHRGTGNQMPPIATNVVDLADTSLVEAWIERLSPPPTDAGATDAGTDAAGVVMPDGGGGNPGAPTDAAPDISQDAGELPVDASVD